MSTVSQRSFSSGEIAPALYARVDQSKYATGLKTCRNAYVMRHGGATNRPGTEFIGEVKDSSKFVRTIPFVFSTTQTYVLEFGNLYIRIIKNGAYVKLTSQAITGITNAATGVVTYTGADTYANGDQVYISGIVGAIGTYLNGRVFKVAGVDTGANTFQLNYLNGTAVNTTSMGAYGSAGTVEEIYTVTTTYTEAELPEIKYIQSADVITLVHPSHAPAELSRSADTSWTLADITFAPPTGPGAIVITQGGAAGGTAYTYQVTATDVRTGIESEPNGQSTATGNATLSAANYNILTYGTLTEDYSGQWQYNIYRLFNGIYALIGIGGQGGVFNDIGYDPDTTITPPTSRVPFGATDEYPSTCCYYQQRLFFANTNNDPEIIEGSKAGDFNNFTNSTPLQDGDSIQFNIAGRQVNEVHHLVDLSTLLIFTESGEWAAQGGGGGVITPTDINLKQFSYNGSNSLLAPIVIGNTALYVQARGSIVRDLGFDYQVDGYNGNDLTIFSSHLVDGYTFTDWAYQKTPHSVVWLVRDDGALIGLTYIREQNMLAWHRHDFQSDATVESLCVIPDGNEDALYLSMKRTVNSATVRYIEKLSTRFITDIKDATFMDSFITSHDGRNTGSTTMTVTEYSGGGWTSDSTVTLTASASYFASTYVGDFIHITDSAGTLVKFEITSYSSATVVLARPNKTVPVVMRSTAITDWGRAVDSLTGLWHLEGKSVSIFGDGYVVANPNNDSYIVATVASGQLTLADAYTVIHVGLPYTTDIATLNIDTAGGETISDKKNIVQKVTLHVQETRGVWVGYTAPPDETDDFLGGLDELKIRDLEGYDEPTDLLTGTVDINIKSEWNSNGSIFIRQTDPVPMSILAASPSGRFPFRNQAGG